jgi:OPA family glycerol-3-phosphate transporter-like MFS transporter
MDFGGSKNAGIAVGLIDGFVYLGTAAMSFTYAFALPKEQLDAAGHITGPATDPANWQAWPISMVVLSAIGLAMAWRIRNAKPKSNRKAA